MILDPLSLGIGLLAGTLLAGLVFALFAARMRQSLSSSNQAFLARAEQTLDLRGQAIVNSVAPVGKTLEALNLYLTEVEKARAGTHGELKQHLAMMHENHATLRSETGRLVQALRTPMGRGSWGEMQLERLLEVAGMQVGVHYDRQVNASNDDRTVKPDIVIRLAQEKSIVIDAKTPMDAYLSAIEAADDTIRHAHLKTHAAQMREQVKQLAAKAYWELFAPSPDFVVMFVPSEGAVASALQNDLDLVDYAMNKNVIIATPTTLFALLKTIAFGWRQEKLAQNAAKIADLGADLYDRLAGLAKSYRTIGVSLARAVESYNTGLSQIESRVLVTARKLKDEHAATGAEDIAEIDPVEQSIKNFSRAEFLPVEIETDL